MNLKNEKKDINKAEIAGHYIFSNKKFLKLKKKFLNRNKISETYLNGLLKKDIRSSIERYLKNFNLI